MRFRLHVGQHLDLDRTRKVPIPGVFNEDGKGGKVQAMGHPERLYRAGEVIESEVDLERFNGGPTMQRKFERLPDVDPYGQGTTPQSVQQAAQAGFDTIHTDSGRTPPAQATAGAIPTQAPGYKREELEPLTEQELRSLAKEEGIDIGRATKKADLVAAILGKK